MFLIVQQELFSIFLIQKPYLKADFVECDIEGNSDMNNQLGIKTYQTHLAYQKQLQSKFLIISIMILV